MTTWRVFDCTFGDEQPTDQLIYGPRWLARLLAWVKGPHFDYQSEAAYQRHYERAA